MFACACVTNRKHYTLNTAMILQNQTEAHAWEAASILRSLMWVGRSMWGWAMWALLSVDGGAAVTHTVRLSWWSTINKCSAVCEWPGGGDNKCGGVDSGGGGGDG